MPQSGCRIRFAGRKSGSGCAIRTASTSRAWRWTASRGRSSIAPANGLPCRFPPVRRISAHSSDFDAIMKITAIEAIHLRVEDPNIGLFDGSYDDCVVCVRTDEGITGIGEVESLAPAIQALVYAAPAHNHARGLGELLIGRDPSNPEELWNLMYDATDYIGRRGLVMHAIGGIDLALWDIKGQLEHKPIAELLGGAHRDRV